MRGQDFFFVTLFQLRLRLSPPQWALGPVWAFGCLASLEHKGTQRPASRSSSNRLKPFTVLRVPVGRGAPARNAPPWPNSSVPPLPLPAPCGAGSDESPPLHLQASSCALLPTHRCLFPPSRFFEVARRRSVGSSSVRHEESEDGYRERCGVCDAGPSYSTG